MSTKPTRRKKKKEKERKFSRSLDPQPFSAATLSSSSQQPFVAAILNSHFSAALLSSHSHQLFSGFGGQPFSSRRCGQGLVVSYCLIMLLWSGVGGQLLSHHVAVVRGWWSAIVTSCCCGQGLVVSYCHIMLLWSGVGGQLLSRSLEGPFRGAFGKKNMSLLFNLIQPSLPSTPRCSCASRRW